MSDQNDRFAMQPDNLSNSLSTICTNWDLFHRIFFSFFFFFFFKWLNFQISHSKILIFNFLLCKISQCYETLIDRRLRVFQQLFIWTSVRPPKCPINNRIGSHGYLRVLRVLWLPCVTPEYSFTEFFCKLINFQIKHWKKYFRLLSKTSLLYKTKFDQRLAVIHQLFSWTSV